METNKFFELLLEIASLFRISQITRELGDGHTAEVHIYVEIDSTYRPKDSQGASASIHDYEERCWRHLNLFQYPCCVHCKIPKFKYADGSVKTLDD